MAQKWHSWRHIDLRITFCAGFWTISFKFYIRIFYGEYVFQGQIHRFCKEGELYVGHNIWPTKKILSFRWSKKAKITLETINSWRSISNFLHFYMQWKLADKILSILQIFKRFDKEREKALIQQSMRKEKLRKAGLCFITGCFMKHFW